MAASVISCPIEGTTKTKIDIICTLKKIHQYEFISAAINDKLDKENIDDILDKYDKGLLLENEAIEIPSNNKENFLGHGFFGKLRSIDDIG